MKKLIAISVVFALIATAAFADVNVGGQALANASLFGGSNAKVSDGEVGEKSGDIVTSFGHGENINISATNDEETFGGFGRLNGDYGFNVWWKPLDLLKIQLGRHYYPFALPTIGAWGFNAMANDLGVAHGGFGSWDDWSFWNWGASLELTPVDGLSIAYYVPVSDVWEGTALEAFGYSAVRAAYSINGVGTIVAKFQAGRTDLYKYFENEFDWDDADSLSIEERIARLEDLASVYKGDYKAPKAGELSDYLPAAPRLGLAFELSAIEGMGLTVGFSYKLAQKYSDSGEGWSYTSTYAAPISVALGFSMGITDTIRIKARLAADFAGSTTSETKAGNTTDTTESKDPFTFGLDILPYFDLGIMKLFIHAGVGAAIPDEGDTEIGFQFNPYIEKNLGPGSFMIGVKVWSAIGDYWKKDEKTINFAVPVGMYFGF